MIFTIKIMANHFQEEIFIYIFFFSLYIILSIYKIYDVKKMLEKTVNVKVSHKFLLHLIRNDFNWLFLHEHADLSISRL